MRAPRIKIFTERRNKRDRHHKCRPMSPIPNGGNSRRDANRDSGGDIRTVGPQYSFSPRVIRGMGVTSQGRPSLQGGKFIVMYEGKVAGYDPAESSTRLRTPFTPSGNGPVLGEVQDRVHQPRSPILRKEGSVIISRTGISECLPAD